ncbi:DUF3325 domain-containing protein [Chitiniphilus eburneus]|uniref:DUF3325 domain-containing protein n=1 Tax=Chitiniphilus eburneus TaxID=2571148 RepID=A0A4U0PAP5_9NEIS|nr:DUF3325 domain-containing protein [Chitiniphilus eburneus]TJZ64735.1 DUF3325 domain-containing protein [Chitiniphilus eburneus]
MIQLAVLFSSYAAFTALCLGMDGHHREVFGRAPAPGRKRLLRGAGWALLLASLLLAIAIGAQGVVAWAVMLTLSTVLLVLLLAYWPRRVAPLGWLGLACAGLALVASVWS